MMKATKWLHFQLLPLELALRLSINSSTGGSETAALTSSTGVKKVVKIVVNRENSLVAVRSAWPAADVLEEGVRGRGGAGEGGQSPSMQLPWLWSPYSQLGIFLIYLRFKCPDGSQPSRRLVTAS